MNKNFNASVTPNTTEEQLAVLKAFIEKRPVFFYFWNSQLTRMEVQSYISSKIPDFATYRFDTEGKLLRYKTSLFFNKGAFANDAIKVTSNYGANSRGAMLNAWFDGDTLCIEAVKDAKVRLINDPATPTTYNVVVAKDPIQDKRLRVHSIWMREQSKLVSQKYPCRTMQPYWRNPLNRRRATKPDYLQIPGGADFESKPAYRILIRFDNCVAISSFAIAKGVVAKWKIDPTASHYGITDLSDVVSINGHQFRIIRN